MPVTATARRPPPWSPWRHQPDAASSESPATPRPVAVAAIKAFHTLAWLSIESCVVYVLYAGLIGRTDRRVWVAAAGFTGADLGFVGNGF